MKLQYIKSIETGHRQLTFGFDDGMEETSIVMSCVKEHIENQGHAVLDKVITHVKEEHGIDEISILQNVFWSALELKIHLRADDKNISHVKAKQILLDCPDKVIEIVANKSVQDSIFQDMLSFYNQLFSPDKPSEFADQYEFSRSLLGNLQKWESDIAPYQTLSKKKFYPGRKIIDAYLMVLSQILAKQDSYSLILACHENQDKIIKMAEGVQILSNFYSNHVQFWQVLIQSIEAFKINFEKIRKNQEAYSAFLILTDIIVMSDPYNEILAAKEKLKIVQEYNDSIEKEKFKKHQRKLIKRIDLMIENLNILFNQNNSGPDFRNTCLYELRQTIIKLEHTNTIKQIDFIFADAKDMYNDFIDELEN